MSLLIVLRQIAGVVLLVLELVSVVVAKVTRAFLASTLHGQNGTKPNGELCSKMAIFSKKK